MLISRLISCVNFYPPVWGCWERFWEIFLVSRRKPSERQHVISKCEDVGRINRHSYAIYVYGSAGTVEHHLLHINCFTSFASLVRYLCVRQHRDYWTSFATHHLLHEDFVDVEFTLHWTITQFLAPGLLDVVSHEDLSLREFTCARFLHCFCVRQGESSSQCVYRVRTTPEIVSTQ